MILPVVLFHSHSSYELPCHVCRCWVTLGSALTPCPAHALQENIDMMAEYLPLDKFKAVYVVDLCHSLCEQAKLKVKENGWKNVHVVEGDACEFRPPQGEADLITFSYSLSSKCSMT